MTEVKLEPGWLKKDSALAEAQAAAITAALMGGVASTHERSVWIDYTNWRGERAWRHIMPIGISFGSQWNPEPQWILRAIDNDKSALREFALADIHKFSAQKPAT
jgi:hypothetical protein